jgi:RHS repeat-associated protein
MSKRMMQLAVVLGVLAATLSTQAGKLPEFMNAEQLTAWRAQHSAPTAVVAQTPDEQTSFFTGKPYDAASGTYLFKYRAYNPSLARWTSADPSGFPDGANNQIYALNPNCALDPNGLLIMTGENSALPSLLKYNGHEYEIKAYNISNETPVTELTRRSVGGYVFADATSSCNFTLQVTDYSTCFEQVKNQYVGRTGIDVNAIPGLGASVDGNCWVQLLMTNDPYPGRPANTWLFDGTDGSPIYSTSIPRTFSDKTARPIDDTRDGSIYWKAETFYCHLNGTSFDVYGGFSWAWKMKMVE